MPDHQGAAEMIMRFMFSHTEGRRCRNSRFARHVARGDSRAGGLWGWGVRSGKDFVLEEVGGGCRVREDATGFIDERREVAVPRAEVGEDEALHVGAGGDGGGLPRGGAVTGGGLRCRGLAV